MAGAMNEKFEKYWGECNLLMAIGAVLDPRYKMVLVKYCFSEIYPEDEANTPVTLVKDALLELYNEYVSLHASSNDAANDAQQSGSSSTTTTTYTSIGKSVTSGKSRYESYVRRVDMVQPLKSDLDVYLEEGVFRSESRDDQFDVLEWWKTNNLKFRILSKMACDVLAIPIITVASESAFSAGGRVIDPYRASLAVETVQVLMCGGDWARISREIKKKKKKKST